MFLLFSCSISCLFVENIYQQGDDILIVATIDNFTTHTHGIVTISLGNFLSYSDCRSFFFLNLTTCNQKLFVCFYMWTPSFKYTSHDALNNTIICHHDMMGIRSEWVLPSLCTSCIQQWMYSHRTQSHFMFIIVLENI